MIFGPSKGILAGRYLDRQQEVMSSLGPRGFSFPRAARPAARRAPTHAGRVERGGQEVRLPGCGRAARLLPPGRLGPGAAPGVAPCQRDPRLAVDPPGARHEGRGAERWPVAGAQRRRPAVVPPAAHNRCLPRALGISLSGSLRHPGISAGSRPPRLSLQAFQGFGVHRPRRMPRHTCTLPARQFQLQPQQGQQTQFLALPAPPQPAAALPVIPTPQPQPALEVSPAAGSKAQKAPANSKSSCVFCSGPRPRSLSRGTMTARARKRYLARGI